MKKRYLSIFALLALMLVPAVAMAYFPPIANAGSDQNLYLGQIAVLSGSGIDPDGDPIVAWYWEMVSKPEGSFAKLNVSDVSRPSFIPDLVGDYVVTLRVSDGQYWSLPDSVVIHVAYNLPPVAVISASATSSPAPLTVTFDGTGSYDPEGRALTYRWTFGDGQFATDAVVTHTYRSAGSFVVWLTVVDDVSQDGNATVFINVEPTTPPTPVGYDPQCLGVTFASLSAAGLLLIKRRKSRE
jgi:chitinase